MFSGGRTQKLADFSDLLPTCCELAGAPLPSGVLLDGRSFARTLLDPAVPEPRQWTFNQHQPERGVSDGRFKLYRDGGGLIPLDDRTVMVPAKCV